MLLLDNGALCKILFFLGASGCFKEGGVGGFCKYLVLLGVCGCFEEGGDGGFAIVDVLAAFWALDACLAHVRCDGVPLQPRNQRLAHLCAGWNRVFRRMSSYQV
jgi:hypothetical protein